MNLRSPIIATLSLIAACASLSAQEFKNSIASTEFDFITEDDPSTFELLQFVRKDRAEMPDKRDDGELFRDAFQFKALFSDHTSVDIFVDCSGFDQSSAETEAMRYVHPLGKLPTVLRQGVNRLCVHSGGKATTAFSDIGLIVVYADNATVRISNHDLEETIFHESVHAAWDARYSNSEIWKRAQLKDGSFATLYAKRKPDREDLAETALFAYTILHHPQRLPKAVREALRKKVPNRILFVEKLIPIGKPVHFDVNSEPNSVAKQQTDSDARSEKMMLDLRKELEKKWPKNRTVRFVFHGHSVPAGYFRTPQVRRFDAYPTLFHQQICKKFPTAVIDVSVTAIGGEASVAGEKRFSDDVLALKPDVVFIDYALNDRRLGLEKSRDAWQSMIQKCLADDILVVLLTPTPDSKEDITRPNSPLALHSKMLRELAAEHEIPVVDSYAEFKKLVQRGRNVSDFLSQPNHPNRAGHAVVARLITKLFK
jgi:lysophospholipase L1-like esterase